MSWSPDGEWLGYTAVVDPGQDNWERGWLFDTNSWDGTARGCHGGLAIGNLRHARRYIKSGWLIQITRHRCWSRKLRWPLTAPSWSPRGKAIAFGRFVPQSMEPTQSAQRGRFEVVIQDAMKRKRLLWASQEFELDDQTLRRFSPARARAEP